MFKLKRKQTQMTKTISIKRPIFQGTATAIITPFKGRDKKIDFTSLGKLIDYQIKNEIDAITLLGSTGEPSTLTNKEQIEIIKFAIRRINKKTKLIVGAGSNNTTEVINKCTQFEKLGKIDAFLIVTPFYNKCTQSGLIKHFTKIANSIKTPIILYNVPSRTNVNMLPQTVKTLSKHPNIIAIKEASGNLNQIAQIINLCDPNFYLYSGDDALTLPAMSLGAKGVISVASNAKPKEMEQLVDLCLNKNFASAKKWHYNLLNLFNALSCEVNPIPIKYLLYKQHLIKNILRLPLTPLSKENEINFNKLI